MWKAGACRRRRDFVWSIRNSGTRHNIFFSLFLLPAAEKTMEKSVYQYSGAVLLYAAFCI